jgi:HEAT repeat protein
VNFLDPNTDDRLHSSAVQFVANIAAHDPDAVVDAPPKLTALLQDDSPDADTILTALQRIAQTHPDAVVPTASELLTYVEEGDDVQRLGAFGVLGMIAKDYPNIAQKAIPTATELLTADHDKLRANAAGLLADLADEYPEQVRPAITQVIELLSDHDENAQYNATSILARVAKAHPEDVEPAIDDLIAVLDSDFEYTRSNACWALGYLRADSAVDALHRRLDQDPSEEVQHAAEWALHEIEEDG